jgi:dihydroorotase-like cyclic amidohydrolase
MPGVVDPEVHFGSHRWVGDEFDSETRGAAAYGITTWGFMQPSANMGQPYKAEKTEEEVPLYADAFGFLRSWVRRAQWSIFLTPKILKDEHALEIPQLAGLRYDVIRISFIHEPGATATYWPQRKSQGYFGFDDGTIYLGLEAVAKLGRPGIVCMHCENWEIARIFEERLLKAGRKEYQVWNERSPHFCEAGHVHAYTYYARILKCPLYIQHTTTPETIDEITRAKADGATVYAQTGPHYLSLAENMWRINVPLRSQETIEILWQALADGRIDTVGSDHTNTGRPRKRWRCRVTFGRRTVFFAGEAALPVSVSDGVNAAFSPRMVRSARKIRRGSLALSEEGCWAPRIRCDLVVVDLDGRLVTNDMIHSSAGWTLWRP